MAGAVNKAQVNNIKAPDPYAAAASVVNNTVTQLFQNKIYKAQASKINLEARLALLSNQQKFQLAMQLQFAQNDAEKLRIMTDAVSKIDVATVQGNAAILSASVGQQSKNTMTTVLIITGGIVLLFAAYYITNKKKLK
jgi:hypothetical protein